MKNTDNESLGNVFFSTFSRAEISVQIRGIRDRIVAYFYNDDLLVPRQNPKMEKYPLVGCTRLLIQYIYSSYLPHCRRYLSRYGD